jgi:hypothetical protein
MIRKAEELYESLREGEYSLEEIRESFNTRDDVSIRELCPERRKFLKSLGQATAMYSGLTYVVDSQRNQIMMGQVGQDQFRAPAGSYNPGTVESILDGEALNVHLFNIYTGEERQIEYNENSITEKLESNLEELEGIQTSVSFYDVEITSQAITEELNVGSSFAESVADNFEQNIENKNLRDLQPRFIEEYVETLIDYQENGIEEHDIKSGIIDVENSGIEGISKVDGATGEKDWCFSIRASEDLLIGILTHEIGHKLGLPHTKYPDIKRDGFFPDVMSYSEGSDNVPAIIHNLADDSVFGEQSHYNWDEMKEIIGG